METRAWIRITFASAVVLGASACPGLQQANLDGGGDSEGDDDDDAGTTLPATTMTTSSLPTGGGSGDGTGTNGTTMGAEGNDDSGPTDGETTDGEDTNGETESTTTDGPGESTSTGDPTTGGACVPMGMGNYANCPMGNDCNSGSAACLDLGGNDGVCIFECNDLCDCPPADDGIVECADINGGGGDECYISCEGGGSCPGGLQCFSGMVCAHSNSPFGYYEGCSNNDDCPDDASCAFADGHSFCFPEECTDDDDCPEVAGGTVTCGYAVTGGGTECYLDCEGPLDCPDGWECIFGYICAQDIP